MSESSSIVGDYQSLHSDEESIIPPIPESKELPKKEYIKGIKKDCDIISDSLPKDSFLLLRWLECGWFAGCNTLGCISWITVVGISCIFLIAFFIPTFVYLSKYNQEPKIETRCIVLDTNIPKERCYCGNFCQYDCYYATVRIMYRIEINGENYSDWAIARKIEKSGDRNEIVNELNEYYPIGGIVDCWYNPSNPSYISLQSYRGYFQEVTIGLGSVAAFFCALICCCSLCLFIICVISILPLGFLPLSFPNK